MRDYFTRADGSDELACTCGSPDCDLTVRDSTRYKANMLRDLFGKPIKASGARCPRNNSYSGSGSSHGDREDIGGVAPCALDILNSSKDERKEILELGITLGFFRYGLGEHQLHLDDDDSKRPTYWIYS